MNILTKKLTILATSAYLAMLMVVLLRTESQLVVGLVLIVLIGSAVSATYLGFTERLLIAANSERRFANLMLPLSILMVAFYFFDDHFNLLMLTTIMVYAIACLGLNFQFGYTGMLNFAGAAFFGTGGYTAAVLTNNTQLPHLLVLLAGGIMAILVGFILILPVLRTKGHYAAVVTIAFSLLFRTLVEVNQALGGAQGSPVSGLVLFGWDFNQNISIGQLEISFYMNYVLLALILLVAVIALSKIIEFSWIGLNLDTIRLDETAAACFGINIAKWKITAFALGNFLLGLVGAFYAMMLGFIAPNNFTFGDSLIMVSIILLGGIGSVPGILLASTLLVVLPEKLQAIQDYRFLIFAFGVILALLFRPNGLIKRPMRPFPQKIDAGAKK